MNAKRLLVALLPVVFFLMPFAAMADSSVDASYSDSGYPDSPWPTFDYVAGPNSTTDATFCLIYISNGSPAVYPDMGSIIYNTQGFYTQLCTGSTNEYSGEDNGVYTNSDPTDEAAYFPAGTYTMYSAPTGASYCADTADDLSECNNDPDTVALATFTIGDAPAPGPGPTNGVQSLALTAAVGFASTTGFSIDSVVDWTSDNLITLFIGSGILVLSELKYWIAAILIILAIVYFAFRAFQFFRH